MARPGVSVSTRNAPAASGPPIVTGTAFMAGTAGQGDTSKAQLIQSIADFERLYGGRQTYSYLYDSVDAFFHEGGGSAYISRVVGPAAAAATVTLNATGANPTILVTALGQGTWANVYKATVASSGGTITLTIKDGAGNTVDTYATTGGKADLLAYTGWKYVVLTDADPTKGDPVAVTNASFAGGSDDLGGINDASYTTALNKFIASYGPGQVLIPGNTTANVQSALLAHAAANGRVALLDAPNTTVLATIEAAATAARATGNGSFGAMFAPWVRIPSSVVGSSRVVPYSAVQAGLEAARDRVASPNVPAAGRAHGALQFVQSFVNDFSDSDRTELIDYGVNTGHAVSGVRETYGYRTLADPLAEPNWVQFNFARLRMSIAARAMDIGESFLFSQIDGRGLKLSEFGAAIGGMLLDFYTLGSLYGDSPQQAFRVDVGPAVNTAETIAAGELHAVAAVRMSPHAELVVIEIVKTPITQSLGG